MPDMKYQEFTLSKIGWSIAAILSVFIYVLYYLYLYPLLSIVQVRQNLSSTYSSNENLEINVSAPIYISNFQNTSLIVSLKNINNRGFSINGSAVILATLPDATGRLMFDNIPQSDYKIPFLLKPGESMTQEIKLKLSDNNSSCVDIRVEILPVPQPKDSDEKFLVYQKSIVMWGNMGYDWINNYSENECANQVKQNQAYAFFYVTNHPYGAFAESTLAKLLLPPWSGFSLLVLIFTVVWLLEHLILPERFKKDESRLSGGEAIKYLVFLSVSSIMLLVLFTLGVIHIFQNINVEKIFFLVLTNIIFLALFFALFVSWLYEQTGKLLLVVAPLSLLVLIAVTVFLIFNIENSSTYLYAILILTVLLIFFAFWKRLLKRVADEEDIVTANGRWSKDKEIYSAYKENDLLKLRTLVKSSILTDTQLHHAKMRYEQVGIYLQSIVDNWALAIKESNYEYLINSIKNLFEDSPNLVLPDRIQALKPLLNNKEGVSFSIENEWRFDNPKMVSEIIIQALKSKIAETGYENPVEPPDPEDTETNAPVSDIATPVTLNNENNGAESRPTATTSGDSIPQKKMSAKPRKKKGNN